VGYDRLRIIYSYAGKITTQQGRTEEHQRWLVKGPGIMEKMTHVAQKSKGEVDRAAWLG